LVVLKRKIIITSDGSSSIRDEILEENYHSGHGALQEARHVFIKNGIEIAETTFPIRIFEMGFGTGLNALLAAEFAQKNRCLIEYTGIEAFPVEDVLIKQLNYRELISKEMALIFLKMHSTSWEKRHELSPYFQFRKIHAKIEEWELPNELYDFIFFDAFGPRVQSSMWSLDILEKMHELLDMKGVFVTYCAKGQLKRDLRSLGFDVKSLPGPPGKREMIRAIKMI
jgi:tRNA U34 5-methylaminomethyl-2-thiouridine-forming methyltransferase MnmC